MPSSSKIPVVGNQMSFPATPPGASVSWSNVTNITADDGNTTFARPAGGNKTYFSRGQQFGHSIPTDATIDGIELVVERAGTAQSTCTDFYVLISGITAGASYNYANSGNSQAASNWGTTGLVTYGSSTDTWGKTWTPAEINNTLFCSLVSITDSAFAAFSDREVDYHQTVIYYTEAGGGGNKYEIRFGDKVVEEVRLGSDLVEEVRFGSSLIK